jgi:two-component system response regulator HydG
METGAEDADLSTVGQPAREEASPFASFVLTVVEGPDKGLTVTVDGSGPSRMLIGQSPACEVRLTDRETSRRHVALEVIGVRLRVTDLGSRNGTYVERLSIGEANLAGGETLRIGATTFRVARRTASPANELPALEYFGRVIGASREMRQLYPSFSRLAALLVPLVVEGEVGTGKEVLAESLHEMGPRANGPFVVVDCSAVAPSLLESELFGEGARAGAFELGAGGTLFIDEIDDLAPALQPKLVRAIERSEIRRIGEDAWRRVDVRVVAATRDVEHDLRQARFRDDLFHRLPMARIDLPPLRKRKGDVTLLARHFARQFGGDPSELPGDLLDRWEEHVWPGNVRELRNAVAQRLTIGESYSAVMDASDVDALRAGPRSAVMESFFDLVLAEGLPLIPARQKVVDEFQRRYVERVLAEHGGNVVRAAASSGIARRYFQILRKRSGP